MNIDNQLIARVLIGQRSQLLAYIWSIVREPQVVEDVYQEVCMVALEKGGQISGEEMLMPWLRGVARNKALQAMERSNRGPRLMDTELLDLIEVQWRERDEEHSGPVMEALRQCMGQLSGYGRQIIELRYGSGLKISKVAEVLNRKSDAVYKAIARVHADLGECVRKRMARREGSR